MPWNKDPDNGAILAHEAEAIIAEARRAAPLNPTNRKADRWPVLWLVLWTTGRRIGEALAITAECVRPAALWFVPEKTKVREWHTCALRPDVARELAGLIDRHHIAKRDRVFPMTGTGAWYALRRHATAAGVHRPKGVHPHMFRHGHAHELMGAFLKAGMPGQIAAGGVKRALGHKGWSTVQQYLEMSQAEVGAWQRIAFPAPPRPED